ncbi:MAG TPA: phage major capsid protein, partial [Steroidobacteraceae bacterium]
DNLSNRNALLKYMKSRGNTRTEDGGLSIATPLDYAANNTYQRYSDWDTLNISASDVISSAEYQWRQIAINVVASGRELRINSGDSRIINLAKSRIKNALRTFNNNFSNDLYSSGALTNQINGLQALIADAGTGTVGGIDSSAFPFWQNTVIDASNLSVTPSSTTIESGLMLPAWLATDRGPDDQVDLIVADNNYYTFFEGSQLSLKRYNDTQKGSAGFVSLRYKNADVIYDGNSGIPVNHMYGINTAYMELVVHQDADLEIMDDMRPVNQDGAVTPILWMGNLTCSNRKQQFVICP